MNTFKRYYNNHFKGIEALNGMLSQKTVFYRKLTLECLQFSYVTYCIGVKNTII